jgi:hypothetical protein
MKVKYLTAVESPEYLAGAEGDIRDLDDSHALRLWGDGYVELVGVLPEGFESLSVAGKATVARLKKARRRRRPIPRDS